MAKRTQTTIKTGVAARVRAATSVKPKVGVREARNSIWRMPFLPGDSARPAELNIEFVYRVPNFALDYRLPVRVHDFSTIQFPHIKSVDGGPFLGGNLGGGYIEVQL